VGLGAIVVPGERYASTPSVAPRSGDRLLTEPLAFLDVAGRSPLERTIERFVQADVGPVSILQDESSFRGSPSAFTAFENVEFESVPDPYAAIQGKLREFARNGIEHSFVFLGNTYAETDLLDLFYFHREARQAATRAMNRDGALDLWVVNTLKAQASDPLDLFAQAKTNGSSYFIREYVNRLMQPRDLRRLACDLLQRRCAARPSGREVKRGIWIDNAADVHRWARIVAPAFIGRGAKIMEETLITRHSSVEKNCCVNYGTVVEDSSILQNTEIGICLDVCHAIANGDRLLSLDRDVVIEIADPTVMRSNNAPRNGATVRNWTKKLPLFGLRKQMQSVPAPSPTADAMAQQDRLETNESIGNQ
jgi:hypothetical protein